MTVVLKFVEWYTIYDELQSYNHFVIVKYFWVGSMDVSKRSWTILNSCIHYYFSYDVIFIVFLGFFVSVNNFIWWRVDYPTQTFVDHQRWRHNGYHGDFDFLAGVCDLMLNNLVVGQPNQGPYLWPRSHALYNPCLCDKSFACLVCVFFFNLK